MIVENLYRYPVKGLNAEALATVEVAPGRALPWDRTFALAQADSGFDPAAPAFLRKSNFMCLLKNAGIARLHASFDADRDRLTIRAPDGSDVIESPGRAEGRAALGRFLTQYLGEDARGTPTFHYVPGHVFADDREPVVSLLSLSSLAAFERDVGAERAPLRFRSNLHLAGAAPWAEFDWIDRTLAIGAARFRVVKRTRRCDATQVNPATAERDADPVRELMRTYRHPDLGVLLRVVEGGRIAVGDTVTLLD